MPKEKRTEKQLAERVIVWLRENGYERIWQEVKLASGVADIVVDVAGRGWVIETKQSLGLQVLSQARKRIAYGASRVSVAAWSGKRYDERGLVQDVSKWLGIGVIVVRDSGDAHEELAPCFHRLKRRVRSDRFRDPLEFCNDDNVDFCAAGTRGGGYWTPYKKTCKQLYALVLTRPGVSLKDAVDGIEHHYRSTGNARASLAVWIKEGKVPGVVCKRDGRFLRLYPEDYVDPKAQLFDPFDDLN